MTTRVLIVDDSLTVRMDLAEAFAAAGFQTLPCATVAEARETLFRGPVDVVVLDVLLPDGDGIELLEELRASSSGAASVVLMLSTESEVKDRIRGLQTGADEYIGKPYETSYVVTKTRELLRARRAGAPSNRSTILVIDDSMTFREALRQALEDAGYAVLVAESGEDGLRVAADQRPNAIVVDGMLPGIDGATVIRRVRLDAALRGVPCLLLTASEDREAELHALDAGADAFVRKDDDVELILAKLAALLRRGAAALSDDTASLLGPRKILAVDDSITHLHVLAAALRDEGYDVVLAQSGEEALELLAVQPVDCILLDLLMPGIGGQETCRRIKSAPSIRDIPLIVLTALENRDAMLDGFGAGADDYIQKSNEFEVLKARIRAQIRRKQFEDENRHMIDRLRAANLELDHEVSERRRAQELERETQAQFRFLFTNNPLPMWVYDLKTLVFLEVNDATLTKYGYSRAEFIEMRIADIQSDEDAGQRIEDTGSSLAILQQSDPWRHRKKDGGIIDVEISSYQLIWRGRSAVLVVAEDTTERKNLERQLRQSQKMEAVGQLTGGIAHDFNNLLGIITANLDLLLERLEADPESGILAQEALDGALRGAELTQRMLAFARKQPLQPKVIDLNETLPGMTGMLRRTLREDIAIEMAPAEELWAAFCDKSQIEDVILNLAINARDAMPNGGKLLIETANVSLDEDYVTRNVEVTAGDYVMLAITDSGAGMTQEIIDRAFEPFFTTKSVGQGTGLGLSMVYGFAKQSGGHVKLYSEVGHGTTVKVYLPRAEDAARPSQESRADAVAHVGGHETILVVEDDAGLRRVALKLLGDLGYAVLEADSARAALDIIESGTDIDLLFTDVVMPGGTTGFELAAAVRERRPNVKALLTTGYSEIFVKNGNGHEDIALISKPYRKHDLGTKIRSILDEGGSTS